MYLSPSIFLLYRICRLCSMLWRKLAGSFLIYYLSPLNVTFCTLPVSKLNNPLFTDHVLADSRGLTEQLKKKHKIHKSHGQKPYRVTNIQISSIFTHQARKQKWDWHHAPIQGNSEVHKLFPFYSADIATLQAHQVNTVSQLFEAHLTGGINKTVSANQMNITPLQGHNSSSPCLCY